ncbi:PepSY domain-containing protein [Staphylococcus lutrae]|uniref:PepSY domain-containing protein n=1 Tax=Staphylococcus lutrae TaxID=155085 RepID=A0AAC9RTI5_9STAP|nr:PepSY domain-containing protein [Staphylococcus lutrae]ARJ51499.1 hypothetical protein B5P37_09350 [Staphylococcus lutrae]PNZ38687.1 hypothetical protein CD134_03870 [Staphylococcus lutrae]
MKLKLTTILLSTGFILAACGQDDHHDSEKEANHTKTEHTHDQQHKNQNTDGQTIALNQIKTQPENAIKTAKSAFDGELKQIEYKKEKGEWVYDVELHKGQEEAEIKVSDKDNKVIHKHIDKEKDQEQHPTIQYSDALQFDKAVKKAQEQQQGELKQWTLKNSDGHFVYEIELNGKQGEKEIVLDAKTSKVLEQDHE